MKLKKKAMGVTAFVGFAFAILVLIIIAVNQVGLISSSSSGIFSSIKGIFKTPEIKYGTETDTSFESANQLINAINKVATGEYVSGNTEMITQEEYALLQDQVASYQLNFYAMPEAILDKSTFEDKKTYETDASSRMWTKMRGNTQKFSWLFSKKFSVTEESPKLQEQYVYADYLFGKDCKKGNVPDVPESSACAFKDPEPFVDIDGQMVDIAPILQLNPVYGIELVTFDKAGKETCRIATNVTNVLKKEDGSVFSKPAPADLWAWGKWESGEFTPQKYDRSGDMIPGNFPDAWIGKTIKEAYGNFDTLLLSQISEADRAKYFPGNRISLASFQGCADSPTWLECPGIRVYYCGKTGYATGQSKLTVRKNLYVVDDEGELHSRASMKILTKLDTKIDGKISINTAFNKLYQDAWAQDLRSQLTNFNEGKPGVSSVNPEINGVQEKDDQNNYRNAEFKTYGTTIGSNWLFVNDIFNFFFSPKQKPNPKVSCYGGNISGETSLKCDAFGCVLCNFELKQPSSYSPLNWLAGHGDPKYVMYYEAFPLAEDTSWEKGADAWLRPSDRSLFAKKSTKATPEEQASAVLALLDSAVEFDKKNVKLGYDAIFGSLFYMAEGTILYGEIPNREQFMKEVDDIVNVLLQKDKDKISKADEIFATALQTSAPFNSLKKSLGANSQYTTAYGLAIYMLRRTDLNEKFYPVGFNSIALKTPYTAPMISGIPNRDGKVLNALSEDAKGYFIQLGKDYAENGDRGSERFYLASPCKADLLITKDKCECAMLENYNQEFKTKEFVEGDVGSRITALTSSLADSNYGVKYCVSPSKIPPDERKKIQFRETDCIIVTPIMQGDTANFCYSSANKLWLAIKPGIDIFGNTIEFVSSKIRLFGSIEHYLGKKLNENIQTAGTWPNHK